MENQEEQFPKIQVKGVLKCQICETVLIEYIFKCNTNDANRPLPAELEVIDDTLRTALRDDDDETCRMCSAQLHTFHAEIVESN